MLTMLDIFRLDVSLLCGWREVSHTMDLTGNVLWQGIVTHGMKYGCGDFDHINAHSLLPLSVSFGFLKFLITSKPLKDLPL